MADEKTEPTEFQRKVLDAAMRGLNQISNLEELAHRTKSNRLAVYSAVRSLERKGLALTFRSDRSQWAVLKVAPTDKWRDRVAAESGQKAAEAPAESTWPWPAKKEGPSV